MARTSLPPGFRFHPTDVELVLYYLKRKVMGKKLHFEAIAEVNIYKFSPWDLPDQSCLKSKDPKWYFFCPREKKYASGARVKRATENGYWKSTGKDRSICFNGKTVGTVKTLIFHSGAAPRGERTDWVIHEYRILDDQLAAAGVQDTYVLCNVFKKNGLGSKNGAQYGAPFKEEDWADDDISDAQTRATPLASDGPSPTSLMLLEKQACTPVTDLFYPGSTSGLPLTEGPSSSAVCSTSDLLLDETDDEITRLLGLFTGDDDVGDTQILLTPLASDVPSPTMLALPQKQACPRVKGLFFPGSTSGLPLTEGPSSSAGHSTSQALLDETDDEITRLLAPFTCDDNSLLDMNGINLDDLNDKMKNKSLPFSDIYDVHSGLGDLDNGAQMNEDRLDFSGMQKDGSVNMFPQDDLADVELNDLLAPSNCSARVSGADRSAVLEIFGSCNNGNVRQLHSGVCFAGVDQYASCENQLPTLPEESYSAGNCLDVLQMFNDQFYQGCNAANVFGFAHEQLESGVKFTKDWKIGTQNFLYMSRLMETIPVCSPSAAEHLALSLSLCGGSSMHIKAEVTHRAGECTNEALFSMMGGSGSCWCNLPLAVPSLMLWVRNPLSSFVDLFFLVVLVYCYLNDAVCFMELIHPCVSEFFFFFFVFLTKRSGKLAYKICSIAPSGVFWFCSFFAL